MTDIELRLKCLEIVLRSWDEDVTLDIESDHPLLRDAEVIYEWVKNKKKDEEATREAERALTSFNEV